MQAVGFDLFQPNTWHEAVENPGKVISEAAKNVSHPDQLVRNAAHSLGPVINAAKIVLSTAQAVVSLIPGIGTGISAAIGAGLAILEGGGPLDIAIKTAYSAIPIPPGVKYFTDMVLDAALSLADSLIAGKNLVQTAVNSAVAAARGAITDKLPEGSIRDLGGQVFDTLAHLLAGALHGQPTMAVVSHPVSAPAKRAIQAAHANGAPLPAHVTPIAQSSRAHLAIHLALGAPGPKYTVWRASMIPS